MNLRPLAASASMFGVATRDSGLKHPGSPKPMSSTRITRTFGRLLASAAPASELA